MKLFMPKIAVSLLLICLVGSIHAQTKTTEADLHGTWILDTISITKQDGGRSVNQDVVQFKDNPSFFTAKEITFDTDIVYFNYITHPVSSHYQLDTVEKGILINEIPITYVLQYRVDNNVLYIEQQVTGYSSKVKSDIEYHVFLTYKRQD